MPVRIIPEEGDILSPNIISENSSELTYLKKEADADADTSAYDIVLNALKKLHTSYNSTMQNMHDPVIKVSYKLTVDMRVIPIVK